MAIRVISPTDQVGPLRTMKRAVVPRAEANIGKDTVSSGPLAELIPAPALQRPVTLDAAGMGAPRREARELSIPRRSGLPKRGFTPAIQDAAGLESTGELETGVDVGERRPNGGRLPDVAPPPTLRKAVRFDGASVLDPAGDGLETNAHR